MKKAFCLILSLLVIMSALSMSAFAAETDVHDHNADDCCSMVASSGCANGMHIFQTGNVAHYTNCGTNHLVELYYFYECAICGYSYTGDIISSGYENHQYEIYTVTDSAGNSTKYEICDCGAAKPVA